ncbi:MAG: hypothetical protein ABJA66_14715 [Actinomycetota bacterium]
MPTTLTELEDPERGKTILRVEGSLMFDDAVLLEKIVLDLRIARGKNITLDLSDLDFLDSDSAPILKRIEPCPETRERDPKRSVARYRSSTGELRVLRQVVRYDGPRRLFGDE